MAEHSKITIHIIPLTENTWRRNSFKNERPEQQINKIHIVRKDKGGSGSLSNQQQQTTVENGAVEARVNDWFVLWGVKSSL